MALAEAVDADATVRVLTNRALFQHIASFADGLPYRVAMFAKAERYRPRLEGRYPSSKGLLPQLAIITDNLPVFEELHRLWQRRQRVETSSVWDREIEFHAVVRCAVRFDRLRYLQWMQQHLDMADYPFEHGLMDIAVTHTQGVGVMEWVLANQPHVELQVSPWALRVVAYRGQLDKIEWLHAHQFQGFSPAIADAAASTGQLETLQYFHDHGIADWTSRAMFLAATNGHLEVVRYLHEHRGRDGTLAARASQGMTRAALHGYHEVVVYLGQQGYEPLWGTLLDVIAAGQSESLRALCLFTNEGCLFDARRSAKRHHNTDMVDFLSGQVASNVWFCNHRKHSISGPRRCQKHLDASDTERRASTGQIS